MSVKFWFVLAGVLILIISLISSVNAAVHTISTCLQLRDNVRTDLSGDYQLRADINCAGVTGFTPIGGNGAGAFTGTFNGLGYKITGLTINGNYANMGLFGYASGAWIGNLFLVNANIVNNLYGMASTGMLVGLADSSTSIINVKASGSASATQFYAPGTAWCTEDQDSEIGGLVGNLKNSYIYKSGTSGSVTTANEVYCCYGQYGECSVGGLVGKADSSSSITNSYSNSAISSAASCIGGFAGWLKSSTIQNSYSTGLVTPQSGAYYIGGFLGYQTGSSAANNHWDSQTSGRGSPSAAEIPPYTVPNTTAQMKSIRTFNGWDIGNTNNLTTTWFMNINPNVDYPRLWFETTPTLRAYYPASTISVKQNVVFPIICDYGQQLPSQCYGATHNGNACSFNSFQIGAPNSAIMWCVPTTLGNNLPNTCNINFYILDARCHTPMSNAIAGTNVVSCTDNGECGDGNPCTDDSCAGGSCVHTNNNAACDDSNPCTTSDTCSLGACAGTPKCFSDQTCDTSTGYCLDTHSCSSQDDIIMRLYQSKLSTGSLWNSEGNYQVCYSDIFGRNFAGANPHACRTGNTNAITWLKTATNSLAAFNPDAQYNIPVCYGNLQCRAVGDSNANGLAAYYAFGNYYGSAEARDYSGNLNHAGIGGATTLVSNGKYGQAFKFLDGDYLSASSSASLKPNYITIGMWVNISDPVAYKYLLCKQYNSTWPSPPSYYSYCLITGASGLDPIFQFAVATSSQGVYSAVQMTPGEWHYITATYDGSVGKIYIDGVLTGSNAVSGVIDPGDGAQNLNIGSTLQGAGSTHAIIDEVRIWNRALSADEIRQEMKLECNANEKVVIRMHGSIDSVISDKSLGPTARICCKKATELNFADINGVPINTASAGSSVRLMVNKEGVGGSSIEYKLYNSGGTFVGKVINNAQFSDYGYMIWTAPQGGDYFFTESNAGETVDSRTNANYGTLHVVANGMNNMPLARIDYPREMNFSVGSLISFNQSSYDSDDDLRVKWDFGDGSNAEFSNILTTGAGNTNHTYTSPGTKFIVLTAEEMTRAQKSVDYTKIYLYREGLNIFAVIDEPSYANPVEIGFYKINGSSSHVENCSKSCPAGKSCYNIVSLYCYRIADSSQMTFNWSLDGDNFESVKNNNVFSWFFDSGIHVVKLKVNYSTVSDEVSKNLIISGGVECGYNGQRWINNSNPLAPAILANTTGANSNCYNPLAGNPSGTESPMCCPLGYECTEKSPSETDPITGWKVHFCNFTGYNACWDITDREGCTNATEAVVENSFSVLGQSCDNSESWIEPADTCYNKTICSCVWNTIYNNCSADVKKSKVCNSTGTIGTPSVCEFIPESVDNKCNETGYIYMKVKALVRGTDPECVDQTKAIPCDQIAKLGFFDFRNFIMVIIALFVIYYLMYQKENKDEK